MNCILFFPPIVYLYVIQSDIVRLFKIYAMHSNSTSFKLIRNMDQETVSIHMLDHTRCTTLNRPETFTNACIICLISIRFFMNTLCLFISDILSFVYKLFLWYRAVLLQKRIYEWISFFWPSLCTESISICKYSYLKIIYLTFDPLLQVL